MDPLEGTHLGRMLAELNSELIFFFKEFVYSKPVSNGKQSAFFPILTLSLEVLNQGPLYQASIFFFGLCSCLLGKLSFFQRCSRDRPPSHIQHSKATGHACRYGALSFGYLGEVNQLCTQFVKIRTAVTCPLVGGPTAIL